MPDSRRKLFTRRRFLATIGGAALATQLKATAPAVIHLLALGDWGSPPGDAADSKRLRAAQQRVAAAMAAYCAAENFVPAAILPLGDNFYQRLTGTSDERWKWGFEQLFPKEKFNYPFYFAIGNHDYEDGGRDNWKHELAYAKLPDQNRWRFPASADDTWYRQEFFTGSEKILTLLMLDSNFDHMGNPGRWKVQADWLAAQASSADNGRWLLVAAHHPMFTDGFHHSGKKDPDLYPAIRKDWLPHLKTTVFYLSGHDHNLQHIRHPDYNHLDFLISGAGGGDFPQKRESTTSPWATTFFKAFGFAHLSFREDAAVARLIIVDNQGNHTIAHEISRS